MESTGLRQTVPPTEEPVSLELAKLHCRVTHSAEDAYIEGLVTAAREACETYTGRQFVTATWRESWDGFFPGGGAGGYGAATGAGCGCGGGSGGGGGGSGGDDGVLRLSRPRLQSVTSVEYRDTAGDWQTMATDDYTVDAESEPARISPAVGTSWPATDGGVGSVRVTFVAGYGGEASVPQGIKRAILFLVGLWYTKREPVAEVQVSELPMTAQWLIDSFRTGRYL